MKKENFQEIFQLNSINWRCLTFFYQTFEHVCNNIIIKLDWYCWFQALNGAEGTVPPGRIYKKVAIVENFFDIIHAVHVDLEGRPGKHAGQKRTYRTVSGT